MTSIEDITMAIATTSNPEQEWSRLAQLAKQIEAHPNGLQALPAVFALYERFPESDFGLPGPLAHAIGKHYGDEYVRLLIESLDRHPTEQTLFLAERVLNARDRFSARIIEALNALSVRHDVDHNLKDEAARILARRN